jgi:glycosyltransferase involved in cell wall biosynthesis
MKILYLIHQFFPEYYSGTEKFVLTMASMMQKAGHRVRVATYSFRDESFFERREGGILSKDYTWKGVTVTALRHREIPDGIHSSLDDRQMGSTADRLLSDWKPDVVHAGHSMRVAEFVRAAKRLHIPYLMTLTDFWLLCPTVNLIGRDGDLCAGPGGGAACSVSCKFPPSFIAQRRESAEEILSGARKIIAPSFFLKGIFSGEMPSRGISVVRHGMSRCGIVRNERRYRGGEPVHFCYAGTLNEHKGPHILIDAFKGVKSGRTKLSIYGDGPDAAYVNALRRMASGDERIEFCGVYRGPDAGRILSSVDVVVIPSCVYENYPLVLHESMACLTPVVASALGGMAEATRDGINGFLFRVGDSQALRKVMERIVAEPGILNVIKENMGKAGVMTVEQEAYSYYRIYREILERREETDE